MTETCPYLTLSTVKGYLKELPLQEQIEIKAKTGREFISVDLKVIRDDGGEVEKDGKEVGEIIVKGDTVTPYYWNLPEETEKSIKDGWLYTGDLAVIDEEGYVNIVDRKKDMILTGGENVYSTEVEHVLYMHPAILEAAVVGVPDKKWGEAVKALVVIKPGLEASEDEIKDFCRKDLAGFKVPKSVEFIGELPKTGSGKIAKKDIRDRYWEGYAARVH
jgi:acyl-CoA synthetase (AMP-forming)/AMP-acid ligase II